MNGPENELVGMSWAMLKGMLAVYKWLRSLLITALIIGALLGAAILISIECVVFSGKPTLDPIKEAIEYCKPGTLKSWVPYSQEFSCYPPLDTQP